ncbi:nicotinate-nucleotide pyrophosphorylase [carboxylating] [Tepidamorphus gemmatus]|uniref:Probable nicotinate-nucleotide pyrophosphorylase [carboxylating] n=1 Tax=Tepidamorphus gemmatus TaxID=747076 RepID=A0A4R3M9J3_9HYPH|nr:carboxylating nicotinate-nucleotide diphosphorylase [Tepidamorphus gemmatus]TCT09273.1 nicotinate-nucleotide pyrophosphorylase [carboxylating] [Tepidamorphus gemmatus]
MPDTQDLAPLPAGLVADAVAAALAEDFGLAGDITTAATIPAGAMARGVIAARQPGVVAGLAVAAEAFAQVDPAILFEPVHADGTLIEAGTVVARLEGPARGMLGAERVALNFLGLLSGVATLTRRFVDAVEGTGARIVCTRKTVPGLRALQKYAVRAGGGHNHRFGLYDAVLIKDNHIAAAGGVAAAVGAAKRHVGHMVRIEVEVTDLDELDAALGAGADVVLLDNMDLAMLAEAVGRCRGRAVTEASGGVTLDTVRSIAATGVDLVSVGALTHSAPVLDLGLDFE